MSRSIAVFAVLLAVMVLGCQDDGMMNPVADQGTNVVGVSKPKSTNDITIPIDALLKDPDPRFDETRILGEVVVRIEGEGRLVDVFICTNAELWSENSPIDEVRWRVSCTGSQRFKLPAEGGMVTFCNDYGIHGRSARIQLCLDFYILYKPGINFRTIGLSDMHIERVKKDFKVLIASPE